MPEAANLNWLSCGEYEVQVDAQSGRLCQPNDESLLFMWKGSVDVEVEGATYKLSPYDTPYIPRGAQFQISNRESEIAKVIIYLLTQVKAAVSESA